MPHCRLTTLVVIAMLILLLPALASALVINEIMYHPAGADDRPLEWIELYNENADPLDLTGYRLCNGVDFDFPAGTWLEGKTYLVVGADASDVQTRYGISNVVGDWFVNPASSPSLSNAGERIEICNPGGRTIAEVRYNDRGKWPSGADGTGHSLSLISFFSDFSDPDSWTLSLAPGGTPGQGNGHAVDEASGPPPAQGLDGGGFVLRWLCLGPYTGSACSLGNARLQGDWLREGAGGLLQTNLLWSSGQVVNTNYALAESVALHPNAGTALPTIKIYNGGSDTINLNDVVYPPDPENVMAYSFVYVDNVTAAPLLVDIGCASDDAISVMLNGATVHTNDACRGVGGPGEVQDRAPATLAVGKNLIAVKVFEAGGGWSFRLRFEERGTGNPITSRSRIQITTDRTKGLNFGGGGTPIEPTDPPPPPPTGGGSSSPVRLSEAFFRSAGDRWIELENRTTGTLDLGGYYLTDDPAVLTKSRIPNGTSVVVGGFRAWTDVELGLDFSPGITGGRVFIALVDPTGQKVLDAYNFEPQLDGYSEARVAGDDRPFSDGADPTRGTANAISVNADIVINEIMYHPIDDDNRKEFVELHNKGTVAHDLTGWRFDDGINFEIPAGTVITVGGYLVIARERSLFTGAASIYGLPASQVLGPSTPEGVAAFGALRNSGERLTLVDQIGRTVDTVRYHEGGEWASWADGGGSSLELIDARQDNRLGQAWDASDDSAKATTQNLSYIARHGNRDSELAIILLDRGLALVDDISIVGGGVTVSDTALIEAGETWRYLKGTAAPPAGWQSSGFADGAWLTGPTGIGYGDADDATVLDDMQNAYMTVFCRKAFTVADKNSIDELVLSVVIDDGFYAYLNGTEVASYNVASPAFDAAALSAIEPGAPVDIDISTFKNLLVNGTNVLAVQVHNAGLGSSDLSFIPRLVDRTTTVGGGSEQVTNGTFNSNAAGWIIEGTHIRSGRTTVGAINGAGSLKIIANGRGDNKVNRIETPDVAGVGLNALTANQDVQISLKARWLVGSQSLLTNGYDHEMARSHSLAVPQNLGTPGVRNQVTQRLITQTGAANLGPTITGVEQSPAVPGAGEAVKVYARVLDADGIGAVTLRYSLTDASASPASVTMTRITGTDTFEATVPGQALGVRVVFFITATDAGNRAGRYPVDITQRSHPMLLNPPTAGLNDHRYCIYRHDQKNPATSFHSYRFWMTEANAAELASRRLLSNDTLSGSFVFGGSKIYYEAQTRFSGSPFARAGWNGSFRVRMPRDNPLHGRVRKFGLEDHHGNGGDGRERLSHYLIRQNQGSFGVPYADVFILARWQVNDRTTVNREHYWVPDGDFVSLWFPGDDEGDFFEMDDRFLISDTGGRVGNADARVLYPPGYGTNDANGANKENYRWFFGLRARNGADEWANLIAFARILDPGDTNDATIDQQIWDFMNVEEMLRIWAVEMNIDDWDSWGLSRGKNCYLYRPAIDGRFNLMAWDLELTYGNVNSFLIPASPNDAFNPGGFSEVNRLMNRPKIKRMYYSILDEMVNGPNRWFHSSYLGAYMTRLAALGMSNTQLGQPGGFIDQRAALVQSRLQTVVYPQVRLAITTNGGANFSTAAATVTLAGSAPTEICEILITTNGDAGVAYSPTYSSMTGWQIVGITLVAGQANALVLYGLDLRGNIIDQDSITVTSTVAWNAPTIASLNPGSALAGSDIEVFGADFHNGLRVFFGATEATMVTYDENGPTPGRILVRVPAGAGTVNVTVRNTDNQTSNARSFSYQTPPSMFIRSDANGDASVDIADAVRILRHLFAGVAIDCQDASDANDDEALNVTDAIFVLDYLFRGGVAPPAPFPAAGTDPGGAALGCQR